MRASPAGTISSRICVRKMPSWQREALSYNVHTPNLWVNVWLRQVGARSTKPASISSTRQAVTSPHLILEQAGVGGRLPSFPDTGPSHRDDDAARATNIPGLHIKDQFRLGRAENVRNPPSRHSSATPVINWAARWGSHGDSTSTRPRRGTFSVSPSNRWGHGYAYWYSPPVRRFPQESGGHAATPAGASTLRQYHHSPTQPQGQKTTAPRLAIDMARAAPINELRLI